MCIFIFLREAKAHYSLLSPYGCQVYRSDSMPAQTSQSPASLAPYVTRSLPLTKDHYTCPSHLRTLGHDLPLAPASCTLPAPPNASPVPRPPQTTFPWHPPSRLHHHLTLDITGFFRGYIPSPLGSYEARISSSILSRL